MVFLFNQFFGIGECGLYLSNGHLVLLAYLVEGHLVCQTAEDAGHRDACAVDHRFAVLISGSMMMRSCMIGLVVLEESHGFDLWMVGFRVAFFQQRIRD